MGKGSHPEVITHVLCVCLRVVHHGTKRTYNFKFDGHAVNIRNTLSVNQPNPHVAAAGLAALAFISYENGVAKDEVRAS